MGRTVRNLRRRLTEHAKLNASTVSEHLATWESARHITDLHNLYDNVTSTLTSLSVIMNFVFKVCEHEYMNISPLPPPPPPIIDLLPPLNAFPSNSYSQ